MTGHPPIGEFSWERVIAAVRKVERRLERACSALESAEIPYAVVGENASAYWIAQTDPSAVRNTPAVEIAVLHNDLSRVTAALESAGFVGRIVNNKQYFLESADAKLRNAVEIKLAGSESCLLDQYWTCDVTGAEIGEKFRVVPLAALVRFLLASFRLIDRVCLHDLIGVGLIDDSWCDKLPNAELPQRLRGILDTPDG